MKIFVSGSNDRVSEFRQGITKEHEITIASGKNDAGLNSYDIIFDLNLDDDPGRLSQYAGLQDKIVAGCAVKKNLAALKGNYPKELNCILTGINALPTFIGRDVFEASFLIKEHEVLFAEKIKLLNRSYLAVADVVGMVSPRIICAVINEACYTLFNGIATEADIDRGMKLGTAYPLGPFEWLNKIGVKDVYETLIAVYTDTHDERYKICPLLEERYKNEKI